jgi:hypothetical protein
MAFRFIFTRLIEDGTQNDALIAALADREQTLWRRRQCVDERTYLAQHVRFVRAEHVVAAWVPGLVMSR